MSDLIAIAYDDAATANNVREKVFELQNEHLIELEDAVVVERKNDGKIKLHQSRSNAAVGAAGGALWGGLIGLIFLMPFLGAAIGAGAGAAAGASADVGLNDDFMRELGHEIKPGTAALFLLVAKATPDKVVPRLAKLGGKLMKTSLSAEQETHLKEAAKAAKASASSQAAKAGAGGAKASKAAAAL
jgi:uncharacterized membrane protein